MRSIMNARIESARVELARGFALTIWIHVEHESGSQGFGGYCLTNVTKSPMPHLAAWTAALFTMFGVERFEDMVGQACRVDADFGRIYRIGHLLKDDWFDPEELNEQLAESARAAEGESDAT